MNAANFPRENRANSKPPLSAFPFGSVCFPVDASAFSSYARVIRKPFLSFVFAREVGKFEMVREWNGKNRESSHSRIYGLTWGIHSSVDCGFDKKYIQNPQIIIYIVLWYGCFIAFRSIPVRVDLFIFGTALLCIHHAKLGSYPPA